MYSVVVANADGKIDMEGRIILRWIGRYGLNSYAQNRDGKGLWSSLKCWSILGQFSNWLLLKEDPAPWIA